ncbi:hypothetical protein NMY22_g686 [Coprinellus aureogranulatus]|nr:hypothetical protein NMY22_g686 [Coprinellus aureogranulatus]
MKYLAVLAALLSLGTLTLAQDTTTTTRSTTTVTLTSTRPTTTVTGTSTTVTATTPTSTVTATSTSTGTTVVPTSTVTATSTDTTSVPTSTVTPTSTGSTTGPPSTAPTSTVTATPTSAPGPVVSTTVSYDAVYDNKAGSLATVACSDGKNGLLTKGFTTFGSLPKHPFIGGAFAVKEWNSTSCGTCWELAYTATGAGNTTSTTKINVLAIDVAVNSFNVALGALNQLTGGRGVELGRVPVVATQVDASVCGL